jgi:integrase
MSLYKQPGSDVWWASITVNGERLRFSTETYDEREAKRVEDKRRAQQHDVPKLKGKTWGSAVLVWANDQKRSDSDLQSLAKFGEHFKDRALGNVTPEAVDKALRTFIKTEGTYNRYVTRVSAVMHLAGVPFKMTKKRDKTPKVRMWLTREQWAKLLAELKPHQKPMVEFALYTGLRQANVLQLQWDHVDLKNKMVWIDAPDAKGNKNLGIPLNEEALHVLKAIQGANPFWVFTFRGQPVSEIKTSFQAACVRACVGRVSEAGLYTGFTWHGLRHTWATWHAQDGTPLEVLEALGGWTDPRMLKKNYAHHVAGLKAKYANNFRSK